MSNIEASEENVNLLPHMGMTLTKSIERRKRRKTKPSPKKPE